MQHISTQCFDAVGWAYVNVEDNETLVFLLKSHGIFRQKNGSENARMLPLALLLPF